MFRLQKRNLQKRIDRLAASKREIEAEKAHIYSELSTVKSKLGDVEQRLTTVEVELRRTQACRRKAKNRIPEVKSRVAAKVADTATIWNIKEKGVITESTREMARNLVSLGVPQIRVSDVVKCVFESAGFTVTGSLTPRSVRRLMEEAYVASLLQVATEIHTAESKIFSIHIIGKD